MGWQSHNIKYPLCFIVWYFASVYSQALPVQKTLLNARGIILAWARYQRSPLLDNFLKTSLITFNNLNASKMQNTPEIVWVLCLSFAGELQKSPKSQLATSRNQGDPSRDPRVRSRRVHLPLHGFVLLTFWGTTFYFLYLYDWNWTPVKAQQSPAQKPELAKGFEVAYVCM